MTCPSCGHASHASRCHVVMDFKFSERKTYPVQCPCKHKAEPPATIHTVDRAMDALVDVCARYERAKAR